MKKGSPLSLIFLMWMILLVHHADPGRATSGNVTGSLTTACSDPVNCLIGSGGDESDDAVEFQMSSHVARMLIDVKKSVTGNSGNQNQPAVNCPPNTRYTGTSCLGPRDGSNRKQPCADTTRDCK